MTVVNCAKDFERVIYNKVYDIAFINPLMSYEPVFSKKETFGGIHTGRSLVEKFLKNYPGIKIVIVSYDPKVYTYPTKDHPDWKWDEKVVAILQLHTNKENFFVDLVERYCA